MVEPSVARGRSASPRPPRREAGCSAHRADRAVRAGARRARGRRAARASRPPRPGRRSAAARSAARSPRRSAARAASAPRAPRARRRRGRARSRAGAGTSPRGSLPAREPDPPAVREPLDPLAHGRLVPVDDRVAARRLVARVPQGVDRQRVLVGRRPLLLDQAAEDAQLYRVEIHRCSVENHAPTLGGEPFPPPSATTLPQKL